MPFSPTGGFARKIGTQLAILLQITTVPTERVVRSGFRRGNVRAGEQSDTKGQSLFLIYPNRVEMDFPSILGDEAPRIYAYSLSSTVAEKFEAIVSLGYDNSRFKDFYDLYVLMGTHDFDANELSEAVKETFGHRCTPMSEIVAFESVFADDPLRLSRWNAFVRKKRHCCR